MVDPFDEISRLLQANPSKAQILLEVEDDRNTLNEALGILKGHTGHPIEYEVIRRGAPSFVLFYLSSNDMKEAVLMLAQAGFTRLKGMDLKEANPKK